MGETCQDSHDLFLTGMHDAALCGLHPLTQSLYSGDFRKRQEKMSENAATLGFLSFFQVTTSKKEMQP